MTDNAQTNVTSEDIKLHRDPLLKDLPKTIVNWPRIPLLLLIRLYQMTISPNLPEGTCRFYPSCSHYGYTSIYKYGVFKGGWMAFWRVMRCNPFSNGGYDPVPGHICDEPEHDHQHKNTSSMSSVLEKEK